MSHALGCLQVCKSEVLAAKAWRFMWFHLPLTPRFLGRLALTTSVNSQNLAPQQILQPATATLNNLFFACFHAYKWVQKSSMPSAALKARKSHKLLYPGLFYSISPANHGGRQSRARPRVSINAAPFRNPPCSAGPTSANCLNMS